MLELSEQEQIRRQALGEIRQMGIDPYPAARYPVSAFANEVHEQFDQNPDKFQQVRLAGRLMTRRIMGKASFAELQDPTGRIQIYVNRDEICPSDNKDLYNTFFKRLLDIGDIIGVYGNVFRTHVGELTVNVTELTLLAKTVKPLPVVKEKDGVIYDAFTDPDQRYRQRYLDLIVNPGVKDVFYKRAKIIRTMREFLDARGYLEVETPVLQPIHGGAAARPFKTHHNALDTELYLRIADELYLKKLIVGGFEGVYEFAKDFRNEGMDRFHNPEFTMVELYVPFQDYLWMMELVEEMIEKVALALHGTTRVTVGEQVIDFRRPWKRYTMYGAIKELTGIDVSSMNEKELLATCRKLGLETDSSMGKGKLIDQIFSETCEPKLIQPTYIMDYPIEMSPLAKKHRKMPGLVERFECICNGKEICNAYTELNDPIDQRERFEEQFLLAQRGDEEAMALDEDFLRAIEYGMPPMSGLGIGIDRLTMILTNSSSIQDVIFFPQMRPEKNRPS